MCKDRHHNRLKLTLIQHSDCTLFLGIHLGYGILNECKVVIGALVNILAVAVIHKDCFINDFLKQTDDLSVGVRRFAFLLCSYLTDEVERLFSQFGRINRIHISFTEREECEELRAVVSPSSIKVAKLTEFFEVDTALFLFKVHASDRAILFVTRFLDFDRFDVKFLDSRDDGMLGCEELGILMVKNIIQLTM